MRFNWLLKYINIAIGAAALGLIGAAYWYAYRPLPKISGVERLYVEKGGRIVRDRLGVPHIEAESIGDALYLQGYATAQERMWQMEGLRRLAAGELSEMVGKAALEVDREARALRLRRLAEDSERTLNPADRAMFAAYARGVNAYIETHRGRLPIEFTLLGHQPRPWRIADSILVGFQMFRTLTTSWDDDLSKRNLLAGGDAAKVNALFPVRSGRELQPGSNAWVVSGKLTASGKPLLANDMHLEWSIPNIWYMAHLRAPGLNVSGVTLPGAPAVIVGHNERIAWGITNLHFDVQDLYVERIDPRTGRYAFKGQVEQARSEREIILVRGDRPVEMTVPVTRHGPVIQSNAQEQLSLRWVAAEPGTFQFPFLEINRAGNWTEFTRALARFPGPASNFAYADIDGNIGYQAAGRLPIRKSYEGDVPVDGASGEYEWQGFIPFEELPATFNPPSGLIVTANQNPFPPGYTYPVQGHFASQYRSRQIRDMLVSRTGWRADEMLAVQKDVYSGFSHYLARAILEACDRRKVSNPDLADAVTLLRGWDGQMEMQLAPPLIITLAYQHVRKAVAESASPGKGAGYNAQMAPAAIESLLRERPPGWFKDYDEMLVRAFADAIDEGRRMQGPDVKRWLFGRYTEFTISHPVLSRLPLVGKYFNVGPVQMSGASTTVKQTTKRLGPSMRMVVDFSNLDQSLLNVPIGQSGHALSSHYKDEWEHYYTGRGYPMQFRQVEANGTLTVIPR